MEKGMPLDKNGVKYVKYSCGGKETTAHAVGCACELGQKEQESVERYRVSS